MQPSGGTDYTAYFEDVVDAVATVYLREFRVKLDLNPMIWTDNLHAGAAHIDPCTDSCSQPHHYNINAISDYYMQPYQDSIDYYDTITVYWTNYGGGVFCKERGPVDYWTTHGILNSEYYVSSDIAAEVLWGGISSRHRPFIQFYDLDRDSSYQLYQNDIEPIMAILLMHETAHVFGMLDVYDDQNHDVSEGWKCVMEKPEGLYSFIAHDGIYPTPRALYNAILSGETKAFCYSCKSTLINKVNSGLDFLQDLTTLNPLFQEE